MTGRLKHLELCEDKYEEALKTYKEERPALAKVAFTLGDAYVDVGSIRQGLFYLERALDAEDAHLREAPGVYAQALESLAYVYGTLAEVEKEGQALEHAVKLYELSGQRLARAYIIILFADFWAKQGDTKKQVAALKRAAADLEGVPEGEPLRKLALYLLAAVPGARGGKASPEDEAVGRYLLRFSMAGAVDLACGRRTSARDLALAAQLGPLAPELADKRIPELTKVQKMIQAMRDAHGVESINAAQALMVLADIYGEQDEKALRLETLQSLLQIQERTFGRDSIFLAWTLKGIGHLYSQLGESEKRLEVLRRALELQEEEFGANHPYAKTTRYYVQMAQAEVRQLVDQDGERELGGLFNRGLPTNPKVNRFAGECVFQEGLGPNPPLHNRSLPPFPIEFSGGGGCAWTGGGLDVPFYAPAAPAA